MYFGHIILSCILRILNAVAVAVAVKFSRIFKNFSIFSSLEVYIFLKCFDFQDFCIFWDFWDPNIKDIFVYLAAWAPEGRYGRSQDAPGIFISYMTSKLHILSIRLAHCAKRCKTAWCQSRHTPQAGARCRRQRGSESASLGSRNKNLSNWHQPPICWHIIYNNSTVQYISETYFPQPYIHY